MEEDATTVVDRWGHALSTSSAACAAAIDAYYHEILSFGRRRAVILDASRHDPTSALANTLAAHFLSSHDTPTSAALLAAASASLESATPYERAVFGAISCLVGDGKDEDAALDRHFELLKEYPKDLLSLKRAQLICFYTGRPDLSLKIVEQVLPHNQDQSYIYGMLAFPLLELGRMAEAEAAAWKGYELKKDDFWSQHNLCHVFQNDCRFKKAVDFMEACSSSWNVCSSFMYTHNWWHVAVCYLEGNSPLSKVLEIYDHQILKELERSDADHGEVYLNALGLLLRLYVRGQMDCLKDRLSTIAKFFTNKSKWHLECLLDLLALWALSCTKEIDIAEDLLKSMKSRLYIASRKKQHSMQRGIMLAEAIYEYGRGNYTKAYDVLGPDFDAINCKMIGASDEQLDVFNEVWYSILLNTGHVSEAIKEIENRVRKREGVPFLWRMLEKAYLMGGRADASVAAEKAKSLEVAYFK